MKQLEPAQLSVEMFYLHEFAVMSGIYNDAKDPLSVSELGASQ